MSGAATDVIQPPMLPPHAAGDMTSVSIVVLLVCGLPGCGKTTLIKALVHKYHSKDANDDDDDDDDDSTKANTHIHTIEYDNLQEGIILQQQQQQQQQQLNRNADTTISDHGDEEEADPTSPPPSSLSNLLLQSWRQTRVVAMQRLDQVVRQIVSDTDTTTNDRRHPQQQRHVILCDDNFYLRSMRKQIYRRTCAVVHDDHHLHQNDATTNVPAAAVYFGTIYLETCVETCRQRNRQRRDEAPSKGSHRFMVVTDDTIQRMQERFEVPVGVAPPTRWDHAVLTIPTATGPSTQSQIRVVEEWIQQTLHPTTTNDSDDNDIDAGSVLYRIPPPHHIDDDDIQEEQQQMQNDRHRADVFWRQCVSVVAQCFASSSKIQLANQVRKFCIQQLQQQQQQELSDYDVDIDYDDDETKKVIWWNMFVQGITKLPSSLTISTVESTSWLTQDEQQIMYRTLFPK